jgi:hypothetical protein
MKKDEKLRDDEVDPEILEIFDEADRVHKRVKPQCKFEKVKTDHFEDDQEVARDADGKPTVVSKRRNPKNRFEE